MSIELGQAESMLQGWITESWDTRRASVSYRDAEGPPWLVELQDHSTSLRRDQRKFASGRGFTLAEALWTALVGWKA